jgi:hypothetical protein
MLEYSYIKKARYLKNYKIYCIFEDKNSGVLDISIYLNRGGVFSYLENESNTKSFKIVDGIITWDQGQIDIAPETVYNMVTKKSLPAWVEK